MKTLRHFFLLAMLLNLAACMHAPAKPSPAPAPQAAPQSQAQSALQQRDYREALSKYKELLEKSPGKRDLLLGLGESYLGTGQSLPALQTFKQVLSTDPANLDALEGSGLAYMGLNQSDKAEPLLLKVVNRDQQSWRALDALGLINDLGGKYQQSMAWYEKALTVMDKEAIIYNNYGYSRIMAHDYAQAETLLAYGLKLDPSNIRIRNNLMQSIAWQGQYERALTVRGNMPLAAALNNVGYIAQLRKDPKAAAVYFQRALDTAPTWYSLAATNLDDLKRQAPPAGN